MAENGSPTPVVLLHLGGPEGSDLQHRTPQRGGFTDPLESLGTGHPGVTLGVGEGAKRMVSWWGVWWWGWGGCRNDSITLKYITYYFCKYLFVFLVKMFHFIFLACWTWLQSTRLYMLSLVSSQNLPSPSWLFAEVLGLWDFRLRCWASSSQVWCAEMWSVFICYGPQVVSSEMVGLA